MFGCPRNRVNFTPPHRGRLSRHPREENGRPGCPERRVHMGGSQANDEFAPSNPNAHLPLPCLEPYRGTIARPEPVVLTPRSLPRTRLGGQGRGLVRPGRPHARPLREPGGTLFWADSFLGLPYGTLAEASHTLPKFGLWEASHASYAGFIGITCRNIGQKTVRERHRLQHPGA